MLPAAAAHDQVDAAPHEIVSVPAPKEHTQKPKRTVYRQFLRAALGKQAGVKRKTAHDGVERKTAQDGVEHKTAQDRERLAQQLLCGKCVCDKMQQRL